jgi:hypothetical protein
VRDDHHCRPVRGAPQQPQHADSRVRVERPGRLVGEDHLGPRDQCPGDRHPLLLAAGEFGRPPPQLAAAQPHPRRRQLDVRPPRRPVVQPERQRDVLCHGQLGQQVEVLEDEADAAPPQHRLPAVGEPGQVGAAQADRAGGGSLEPGRALQQRRLAGPGDAEHGGERSRRERQRHPVKRRARAEGAGEQDAPPPPVPLRHVGQRHRRARVRYRGLFKLLSGVSKHVSQRAGQARSAQWCRPPGRE